MATPYILAVDDEVDLLGTLTRALGREGYEIGRATSGYEAWQKIIVRRPDIVLLDIMMPGMDGLTLCKQLRGDSRFIDLPILFLTAKDDTEDVVAGLDAGGDDYVMKPFELPELQARVRALLRRGQREETKKPILELGNLRLDSDTYQVEINGENLQLTATEHRLLRYMMEHPKRPFGTTRRRLAILIWCALMCATCAPRSSANKWTKPSTSARFMALAT
jgi:two-component system OmpR family response regulator